MTESFFALTASEAATTETEAFVPPPGDPRRSRVPFGIFHMDSAIVSGVEPFVPQMYAIQGGSGGRKTTFVINVIISQALSGKLPPGTTIGLDLLETGMTTERLFLIMQCIVATKIMIYEFHTGKQDGDSVWKLVNRRLPTRGSPRDLLLPIVSNGDEPDTCLTPELIKSCYAGHPGRKLSSRQADAYERAVEVVQDFPVFAVGISEHLDYGVRDNRYTDTWDLYASLERWLFCTEKYDMRQLVVDYIQEYRILGSNDHYQKQLAVVPVISNWVGRTGSTAWVVSQEGITHQRDARSYDGEVLGSSGGDILKAQAQVNFRCGYRPHVNSSWAIHHRPVKSRKGYWPTFGQPIEPNSGAYFGLSRLYSEIKGQF